MSDTKYESAPAEPPPSYDATTQSKSAPNGAPAPKLRAPLPLHLPALDFLRGKRVILASGSPRRKQLLGQIGLTNLAIVPSNFEENLSQSLSPFEYVLQTATQKCLAVYRKEVDTDPALIIAADTVVVGPGGQILEKPRSEKQHVEMLQMLRDAGEHKVCTGIAVIAPLDSALDPGYAMETHVEETSVVFDPNVTDDLVLAYVRTREGADKAGGYGIQGIGSILVESISGDYNNVVGLPLRQTLRLIEQVLNPTENPEDEDGDVDVVDTRREGWL